MAYHGGLMQLDPKALRMALGRYATGVTITTCRAPDGHPVGLTVNSFNALSLDPALVLWSLRTSSPSMSAFRQSGYFAVNVLTVAQIELSRVFASPVPDRFAQGDWREGFGGSPVLAGCCANLECATEAELPMGDHVLFVGRVLSVSQNEQQPLLYQSGQYRRLGPVL